MEHFGVFRIGKVLSSRIRGQIFRLFLTIFFVISFSEAKQLGVEISVVTMEGTHCSMENIGMLADVTGDFFSH